MTTRAYPAPFSIYKSKGAAQFTIMHPRRDDNGRISKNGAVLLETSDGADKKYNWSTNKISFAIGMSDICNIFNSPDSPDKLIHATPNSPLTKTLELRPGEGKYSGTYLLMVGEKNKDNGEHRSHTVPISAGEYTVLLRLLMTAAPQMIGWS